VDPAAPVRFSVLAAPPAGGETRARLGRMETPHGVVDTPVFMPVGTNATVKALDPDDLHEIGAQIILANTYHLSLRPGHARIARLGGLHAFMAWDGAILTDSGGFQVVSLGDRLVIDDDGVTFRSHLDGALLRFTPEHSIAIQEALEDGLFRHRLEGPDQDRGTDPLRLAYRVEQRMDSVGAVHIRPSRWAEQCARPRCEADERVARRL